MPLSQPSEIFTARLALIPITPAALHAEQQCLPLAPLIHCVIPANWPPVDWEPHVFTTLLAQYARNPHQVSWHRYVAFLHPDRTRTLIGALGAFHQEKTSTECEIGYTILPPYEGRGLATEAALALISQIRHDPSITSIIAHTFPNLTASIRVMEKCGLRFEGRGEEAGTLRYRLNLADTFKTQSAP